MLILLLLVLYLGFSVPGFLMTLIINGLIGLIIIIIINFLPVIEIPINIWTVLIAAIGGIPGILLLVILNVAGVKLG